MKKWVASRKLLIVVIAIFVIVVGIIFFLIGLDRFGGITEYGDYTIYEDYNTTVEKYDSAFAVEGFPGGEKAYYINGKVSATKDKDFSLITFNLYDKKGNKLGTAVAGIKEMQKDKKYDFKALALVKESQIGDIDHFSLKSIE